MSPFAPPGRGGGDWPRYKPRLPGTGARRAAGRKAFGATWWGREWVEAIEGRARLDPNRLPRARTYARTGAVGELDVAAGEVTAPVQGSRRTPYEVRVRVRRFSDREWDLVTGALTGQLGHAAALLEGELVPEVVGDVRAVGLDLLPGPGEVQPRCSCPDWADPCKHAAAVCYLVADELDRDPFLLFLLRGRNREELLAAVRLRRGSEIATSSGTASPPDQLGPDGWEEDAGVLAREAWSGAVAAANAVPGAPAPVALPTPARHPGRPVLFLDAAPQGSGVDTGALRALAADCARRAFELAGGRGGTGLELTLEQDCARWASSMIAGIEAPVDLDELAHRCKLDRRELFRRALAWKAGGPDGLAALLESWNPAPSELAPGRVALGAGARATANRVTRGERQLRFGRDGRWHPYHKVRGTWQPDGEPTVLPLAPRDLPPT